MARRPPFARWAHWCCLLLGARLAALAPGGLLLRRGSALLRGASGARLLSAAARRTRRVGDPGRALLRHALLLQALVLLLVLHVRALARHPNLLPIETSCFLLTATPG